MHKNFLKILTAALAAATLTAVPMSASCATPEEAEAIARQYGVPEETLQSFWNEYYTNPELYPPDVIDEMIEQFIQYKDSIVTNVMPNPDATVPPAATTTTTAVTQTTAVTDVTAADNNNSDNNINTTPAVTDDGSLTLTMPDGSTITRINTEQFISLSYDDKMAYLSTFTTEQQTVIINNFTPEEYKSMLRQLPAEKKLDVIDSLSSISESFGVNLTVDEMTDNSLSFSMKNHDGELIGVGSVNNAVENTGYDRRGILALTASLVSTGIAGLFILVRKCFNKKDTEV